MLKDEKDWELSEDYYTGQDSEKKLSLEDFITEQDLEGNSLNISPQSDELLKKTIEDVHQVLALAKDGMSIEKIAELTGLDEKYVYDIQVCAQGFREDDEIAVAHLVLG
ncbi:helix-turn-helix domain-containing protein [Lacrimispora defluvii]|uniref:Helix-turn-helix domain-containing protein n=1 Tax=Lacrimispora defluvii TaxID=2719233 RepID=A0ABX1VY22_9FIRM|nr:helix-turn-helix domain-containing protein [Lacrimispora defluvii]NNJ32285.1 helix-turn-helix domain-containing protein [Lacrimispora defluvii]